MSKQVAVFWDLDNTYWTILNLYGQIDSPIEKIIDYIDFNYRDDSIRIFRAYADFEKLRSNIPNAQTIIQKKRVTPKHVFSSNSGSQNRKNAGDIELGLDALETVFKTPEISNYVIISADKDMIPLINRLRYYDKIVHLIYLEAAIAEDKLVLQFPNESTSVENILSLDINTIKKNPTDADVAPHVSTAIKITKDFYARNISKPDLYLGDPIFVAELVKTGIPKIVASEVLNYCIKNGHLVYDKENPKKLIIPW